MKEPAHGSVVMTDGPTGTAWQRHHHDGEWHSTAGITQPWEYVEKRDPELLFEAPARPHDGHDLHYVEERVNRIFKATITSEGDVKIDTDEVETDFGVDTQTHVWCMTCQETLTPENSGLSDEWQVL